MKEYFSTGDIAKLCDVTPKTVVNWINANRINSFRTVGGARKVAREDLILFFKENNLPLGDLKESSINIIVFDTNKETAKLIKEILQSTNIDFNIIACTSFEDTILKIGFYKPDLIFLDVNMQNVTGFKICDLIINTAETTNFNLLFMTVYVNHVISDEFKKRKITSYLKKPIIKETVVEIILESINKDIKNAK